MVDHDDELLAAVRELTRTIEALQQDLESTQRRPRLRPSPLRPPTPRELLEFTDEVAIPATIAVLETSVRALEGFQRALALARTERDVRDRTTEATSATNERARELRQTTLSQLDGVLARLQQAARDGTLPADESARELLAEARELRDDIDSRLRDAGTDVDRQQIDRTESTDVVRIDVQEGRPDDLQDGVAPDNRDDPASRVDVDAELETLKEQYGDDEAENDIPDTASENADRENEGADENGETTDSDGDDDDVAGSDSES
ncbi:DUF7547 family protein [Natronorubrum aibiense]|uniref:Uncharacterized protein n=1 Tax=Natronorubrum aibiense TaxID=348826 RepID=A0A5P9P6N2_9EURY|nr:hypothetical protein [Natronorubrum aibiense]QFU83835.1 hypothetical protein GCU68_15470 [Natronorubrum aibiense]